MSDIETDTDTTVAIVPAVIASPTITVAEHIDTALGKVRAIYDRTSGRIEALKSGEKIPATKLAEEVALEFGTTGAQLYPTLRILLIGYPGVKILRGAHGGVLKL